MVSKKFIILLVGCYITCATHAQIRHLSEDAEIFGQFLQYAQQSDNCIIHTARFFMDKPYLGGTLEGDSIEQLVVNLRDLDCVTLVENVIALQLMLQGERTFGNYLRILQQIRYRNGIIDGYLSRLHYFSEWLDDNRQKGIITLPTIPGCRDFTPAVSFMSTHCDSYPALKSNPDWCKQMPAIEKEINALNLCYIPKEQVKNYETNLRTGDVIAITTHIQGLDVAHTGFAVVQNGRVYLLHASLEEKKVVISDETLHDYLARRRNHSGVIVARIN